MALFGGLKKNSTDSSETVPAAAAATAVAEESNLQEEYRCFKERVHLGAARMKPHYIGNVLSALFYLCDVDSERAQDAILALSGYLRQNVECINRDELLSFSWELEHMQHYIDLEQLRFEDRIQVFYDLDIEDFDLPSLTLQPLVENAVKHGLAPRNGEGNITLQTRRLVDGSVQLKLIDNGVGFDTAKLAEAAQLPHSLECIRLRLERELEGTMHVESIPGAGTTVTIQFKPPQ